MAFAPDSSNFVLTAADSALSHYHVLTGINGLIFTPGAAQGTATMGTGGKLALLNGLSTDGFLVLNSTGNTLFTNTFSTTATIDVTNGTGIGGATTFDVIDNSSLQKVSIQVEGDAIGDNSTLCFFGTDGVGIVGQVDNTNNRINLYFSSVGGGGGSNSTYLCQTGVELPPSGINLGATNAVLAIGKTSASFPLDILCSTATNGAIYTLNSVSDGAAGNALGGIQITTYGGPTGGGPSSIGSSIINVNTATNSLATPQAIASGQTLFKLVINGYGTSAFHPSALISATASGNFTNTSTPSAWNFYTTPVSSITPTLALTIDDTQNIQTAHNLTVGGNLTVIGTATYDGGVTYTGLITAEDGIAISGADVTLFNPSNIVFDASNTSGGIFFENSNGSIGMGAGNILMTGGNIEMNSPLSTILISSGGIQSNADGSFNINSGAGGVAFATGTTGGVVFASGATGGISLASTTSGITTPTLTVTSTAGGFPSLFDGNVHVVGNLQVDGTATYSGGVTYTGLITAEDGILMNTAGALTLAGAIGMAFSASATGGINLTNTSGNLTMGTGSLVLGAANLTATTGHIQISGTGGVSFTSTSSGQINFGATTTGGIVFTSGATGGITIPSSSSVGVATNTLAVSSTSSLTGAVTLGTLLTLTNGLTVNTTVATFNNGIAVTTAAGTFAHGVTISANGLGVTGGTTTDTLGVSTTSTFSGLLTANAGITVAGTAALAVTSTGGITSSHGVAVSAGGVSVVGGTSTDTLTVTATSTNAFNVTGTGNTANFAGNVAIGGNLSVSGTISFGATTFTGLVTAQAGISVTGTTALTVSSTGGIVLSGGNLNLTGGSGIIQLGSGGLTSSGSGNIDLSAGTGLIKLGSAGLSSAGSGSLDMSSGTGVVKLGSGGLVSGGSGDLDMTSGTGIIKAGSGGLTSTGEIQVVNTNSSSNPSLFSDSYAGATSNGNNIFQYNAARGTSGSKVALNNGDTMTSFKFYGYGSDATYHNSANMFIRADSGSGYTSSSTPSRFEFQACQTGTTVVQSNFIINGKGVGIAAGDGGTANVSNNPLYPCDVYRISGTSGQIVAFRSSVNLTGSSQTGASLFQTFAGTNVPSNNLYFQTARGTQVSSSALVANDGVGDISFFGHDGSQFTETAAIKCTAPGSYASNNTPSQLSIYTTPSGTSNLTQALLIDNTQSLTVTGFAVSNTYLGCSQVSSPPTPSSTQNYIYQESASGLNLTRIIGSTSINSGAIALASTNHAGNASINSGVNPTISISTNVVQNTSKIFVSWNFSTAFPSGALLPLWAGNISAGSSFTIGCVGTLPANAQVSWWVVNTY